MIFCAGLNGFGAVELLQRHDADEVVGEGHRAEGEAQIGKPLDLRVNTKGRANQKARRALAL